MNRLKTGRAAGFAAVATVYLTAGALGVWLYGRLPLPVWAAVLVADAAATVWVFLFSLLFRNASVYDPYWSVQPPVILLALAWGRSVTAAGWLLIALVCLWAVRLTANWAVTFRGLAYEDWRYVRLRQKTGAAYPLVNFGGIHMVPTLIVWACVMPGVDLLQFGGEWNPGVMAGAVLCLLGVGLELAADIRMQRFRRTRPAPFIRQGLWKWSRHPNYLGEILFWWGVAALAMAALPGRWWLAAGAAANTLLFVCVSIPMADRRQAEKPGYAAYRAATRCLLPIPKRDPADK